MHEQAMYRDLLRKIEEVSAAERVHRITRIRLWVGALSHLTEDRLREQWPHETRGTVAEGARLEVEVSADPGDPRAQGVVLTSIDVEPVVRESGGTGGGRVDMDGGGASREPCA